MKQLTTIFLLTALLMITSVSGTSALEETAQILCNSYPNFSASCKNLKKQAKVASKLLTEIQKNGYETWEHLHKHCRSVNYKDIFGLCQKLKQNEGRLDRFLADITASIFKIANLGTDESNGVYNHCKDEKNRGNKLCHHLIGLAQTMSSEVTKKHKEGHKKGKDKELLTGTINVLCKERPDSLICKHMVALASIMNKVKGVKRGVRGEILSNGKEIGGEDEDRITMFAVEVVHSGRDRGSLEEMCNGESSGICNGVDGTALMQMNPEGGLGSGQLMIL